MNIEDFINSDQLGKLLASVDVDVSGRHLRRDLLSGKLRGVLPEPCICDKVAGCYVWHKPTIKAWLNQSEYDLPEKGYTTDLSMILRTGLTTRQAALISGLTSDAFSYQASKHGISHLLRLPDRARIWSHQLIDILHKKIVSEEIERSRREAENYLSENPKAKAWADGGGFDNCRVYKLRGQIMQVFLRKIFNNKELYAEEVFRFSHDGRERISALPMNLHKAYSEIVFYKKVHKQNRCCSPELDEESGRLKGCECNPHGSEPLARKYFFRINSGECLIRVNESWYIDCEGVGGVQGGFVGLRFRGCDFYAEDLVFYVKEESKDFSYLDLLVSP